MEISLLPPAVLLALQMDDLALSIRSFNEPLKRSVQQVMLPSIKKNFEVGGRPAWPPLSDVTLTMRAYQGVGNNPLVRTGALKRAATALARWKITKEEAAVTGDFPSTAWYGPLQQSGFTGGYGNVTSPRPFMVIQPEDTDKIEDVFIRWFRERLARHGFIPGE